MCEIRRDGSTLGQEELLPQTSACPPNMTKHCSMSSTECYVAFKIRRNAFPAGAQLCTPLGAHDAPQRPTSTKEGTPLPIHHLTRRLWENRDLREVIDNLIARSLKNNATTTFGHCGILIWQHCPIYLSIRPRLAIRMLLN